MVTYKYSCTFDKINISDVYRAGSALDSKSSTDVMLPWTSTSFVQQ
jgi:hypothetical protein